MVSRRFVILAALGTLATTSCASPVRESRRVTVDDEAAAAVRDVSRTSEAFPEAVVYRNGRYVLLNQGFVDLQTGGPIAPDPGTPSSSRASSDIQAR